MRSAGDRLFFVVLLIDAVLLAVAELAFLPLRVRDLAPGVGVDGNWPLPVSVLAAGLTMPLLVKLAAGLSTRMSIAGAPLLLWLATVIGIGIAGPGGDLMLTNDWRALALLAVGALPGAVVLGGVLGTPPAHA
ncbi:hypothetical protein NLX83_05115 [Allokutzneria sp. A3M-2-11 16]|uniref:hypothetical protein n=1 Tax=Allokutzneria sp. A3M-2-11 16 TaxID=2962043 RepID=UPI0020B86707|nr:hypothetical protein [Allokutzneria sp. A3M-2-11 16]MCP3798634.1 hypothetical protein [Allokutzneria sp. A3M-2-11 16]